MNDEFNKEDNVIVRQQMMIDILLEYFPEGIIHLWRIMGRAPTVEERMKYRGQYERYITAE